MKSVEVKHGNLPLVLAIPHSGNYIPEEILNTITEPAKQLIDTDWNVHRLYDNLLPGTTVIKALFHRYVIDANRDPSGSALYPDRPTTALCPLTTFDGDSLYLSRQEPNESEITRRRIAFHIPYHNALRKVLNLARSKHGIVILYDCHSIRSRILNLFPSHPPDFNIGTNDGTTCSPAIENKVRDICEQSDEFSTVVNDRFKGGWTTRNYGQPSKGIHAIQMELAQSTCMLECSPWTYDDKKAQILRQVLARILKALVTIAGELTAKETCQHGYFS